MTSSWKPLRGPQSEALESQADILFYGGAAGGGKTDLLIGAACSEHWRSIIFRREYPQLQGIIERTREVIGDTGKFNKSEMIWSLKNGRTIELGAVQYVGDERKYQGRAHDLKAFDELAHFSESQFRTLCGWLRSANAAQRCRVLATGNPPTDAEGEWIIRFFAPWLDKTHAKPALPGELRWFTTLKGKETEVENGHPFEHEGETITPKSRTFIPAHVEDNPYYIESGYKATLQAMPEPLRSKLLYGNFSIGRADKINQLIPTDWLENAMQSWREFKGERPPLTCIGVDVARGGDDQTVLTLRYSNWFARQLVYAGKTTLSGEDVAQLVLKARGSERCKVQVDVIGVGASAFDAIKRYIGGDAVSMCASNTSHARVRNSTMGFTNKRSEWWWKLREALDPETGQNLMLADDRELLADLAAPRFHEAIRGLQVESKEEIKKRLGRSPDKGDSIVYAHAIQRVPGDGFIEYYAKQAQEEF